MSVSSINDLVDLSCARDLDEFKQRMARLAHDLEFGICHATLVTAVPGQKVDIRSCAICRPDWNPLVDEAQLRRDPVVQKMKKATIPFIYDADMYGAAGAHDLWEEQAPFGYKTGVVVALHMPGFKHFVLGLDRDAALPKGDRELVRLFADAQLFAVHAEVAGRRVLAPSLPSDVAMLTPRELEVLRMARDGKSAWITSQLLSISERTVKAHLERIYEKLGVASKTQAILKAHETGLF